jgi:hypothetical protein
VIVCYNVAIEPPIQSRDHLLTSKIWGGTGIIGKTTDMNDQYPPNAEILNPPGYRDNMITVTDSIVTFRNPTNQEKQSMNSQNYGGRDPPPPSPSPSPPPPSSSSFTIFFTTWLGMSSLIQVSQGDATWKAPLHLLQQSSQVSIEGML